MPNPLDPAVCDRARKARDPRFDGLFFIGVTSTGIYCRPICPAPSPRPENIVYYNSADAAAAAGLRPCLRCRPETAPGTPAWNGTSATVSRAMALIRQGALNEDSVASLAERLGVTDRHLRRLFQQHLGASPKAIADNQRLLFARKLITETDMPITQAAMAAGYGSLRRFNAAFQKGVGRSPSQMRRNRLGSRGQHPFAFHCRLEMNYRPPYDWERLLAFFRARAIPGVEQITDTTYRRTIGLTAAVGQIAVQHATKGHALILDVGLSDSRELMTVLRRVRRMFDLDANPQAISAVLGRDKKLGPLFCRRPGLRLPAVWDPFESVVRAVVGQQISVKGAITLLGRLVRMCGTPCPQMEQAGLTHLFPTPDALMEMDWSQIGMPAQRKGTLQHLARQMAAGDLKLETTVGSEEAGKALTTLSGIGEWTASYIAMRGLGDPDAFPAADLGIRKALAVDGQLPTARQVLASAETWRPWRAYAAIHLWQSLTE